MRSMSGSRRNSGSSLVSSSSASSNLSHLEEDTWILWGRIVNEWDEWRRKKDKLLKELIRKGIPHHFRAIVWQLLGNATDMPVKNQYSELLKMSSPCEKLIRRDIARTYPEHEFFKGQDSLGQEVLFNVMKAYSLVDREVGYCQGSAFIVGLLLMQMPEEEAFCVFVRLMQEYRLRELFKPTMDELGLCIYQFEYLLQVNKLYPSPYVTLANVEGWMCPKWQLRPYKVHSSDGSDVFLESGLGEMASGFQKLVSAQLLFASFFAGEAK
ncbi:EVI5-like protein isoform 1-T1 [Salvelinus alpinus]